MIFKSKKISYGKVLDYLASRGVFRQLSPAAKLIENLIERRMEPKTGLTPFPIFIIGAPRTGSTILYQALTDRYLVNYIDNCSCRWCEQIVFGMWLSAKLYKNEPHGNFSSNLGITSQHGGRAPSECGEFWYRWLPRDVHFVDDELLASLDLGSIEGDLRRILAFSKVPVIFKNLNMGQRLLLLKTIAPESKFIHVRRSPHATVKSILKARSYLGVSDTDWWSVKPKNYRELLPLPEVERCVAQVFHIEQQIMLDLQEFPANQVCTVHYEDFGENMIQEVGEFLGLHLRTSSFRGNPFLVDSPRESADCLDASIAAAVAQFPFSAVK